jgi:PAS domain S-box-containing protein
MNEFNKYKYVVEQFSVVVVTDTDGIITYVNDKFCEISKYSKQELLGTHWISVVSKYHSNEYIADLVNTIERGKVWRNEIKMLNKEGNPYWTDTTIIPLANQNGQITEYFALQIDITDRKEAEAVLEINNEELLANEEQVQKSLMHAIELQNKVTESGLKLQAIINKVPGVVYEWAERQDGSYGFTFVSPRLEEYFGISTEDAVDITKYIHPDDIQRWRDSIEQARKNKTDWYFEGRIITPNGEVKWWEGFSTISKVSLYETIFVGMMVDTTERKNIEKILIQKTDEVEKRNKQLEDIANINSHKIRGPVATILGLLSLFDLDNFDSIDNKNLLDKLKITAERLDNVIREIVGKTY